MYFLVKIQEYSTYWHLYFLRFIFVLWFLIWPFIFALSFWFFKEISKSKKIDITFSNFLIIKKYSYVFHNFMIMAVFISAIFNTGVVIYTLFDTYILSLDTVYSWIWKIPSEDVAAPHKANAFFVVLIIGYILHILSGSFYVYFNLYHTKSYCGEKWRNWIRTNMQSNPKWIRFKHRHKTIYEYIYPWFLDTNSIEKYESDTKILVIDSD